jgi:hypothetical protein
VLSPTYPLYSSSVPSEELAVPQRLHFPASQRHDDWMMFEELYACNFAGKTLF